MEDGDWDLISTPEQGVVKTHGINDCGGRPCCVHNPSEHHMRDWPIIFDMKKMALALRLCAHGYGHPDPDSLAYFCTRKGIGANTIAWLLLHQCDDCCLPEPFDGLTEPFDAGPVG